MGIGDELMVTGMVREAQVRDPRRVLIRYEKGKLRWSEIWENNPRIVRPGTPGDFQILEPRENYLRPYIAEKTPNRWTWKEYRPPVGEIYLTRAEQDYAVRNAGLVVLGSWLKSGAPPNKAWPYWGELAALLADLPLVRLGPPGNAATIPGVRPIETTIRQAAAIVSKARLVITQEGALHHIAAALATPAVVIFGGYISPKVTGYFSQTSFFRGDGLGCGMRTRCSHCEAAMASISPEEVAAAARAKIP